MPGNEPLAPEAIEEPPKVLTAARGSGPLLQRDYQAVIEGATCPPEEAIEKVRAQFPRFSPDNLAAFECREGFDWPLEVGHEMQIVIRGAGLCHVRIVHANKRSLTLRTLDGHPEAGRITFGAYHDETGRLIFRIRSRARSSNKLKYVGYVFMGREMQRQVWITFIERIAELCGGHIESEITVKTTRVKSTLADRGEIDTPTFAVASDASVQDAATEA
jgi:hypothetical protein